jgi:hypothetical protein
VLDHRWKSVQKSIFRQERHRPVRRRPEIHRPKGIFQKTSSKEQQSQTLDQKRKKIQSPAPQIRRAKPAVNNPPKRVKRSHTRFHPNHLPTTKGMTRLWKFARRKMLVEPVCHQSSTNDIKKSNAMLDQFLTT